MVTDAPPGDRKRAEYLKSDRIKSLDLPQNSVLPNIAKDLEAAMKADNIRDVRKTCAEFLNIASHFYQVPNCSTASISRASGPSRRHP